MPGVTIRIFLADGKPTGLRVLEKSNWTGRGLDFARAEWPTVRARAEFDRPGVYLLTGPTDWVAALLEDGRIDGATSHREPRAVSSTPTPSALAELESDGTRNLREAGNRMRVGIFGSRLAVGLFATVLVLCGCSAGTETTPEAQAGDGSRPAGSHQE